MSAADDIQKDNLPSRAPFKIERHTFEKITNLMRDRYWIREREAPLFDLIDFCPSIGEQNLIFDLVYRFEYLSSARARDCCLKIVNKITAEWGCDAKSTKICAIEKSPYSDSSQAVMWFFKPAMARINGWITPNFFSDIKEAAKKLNDGDTVVLVDDFVGTGSTLIKAVRYVRANIPANVSKISIKACSFAAMRASLTVISAEKIEFFSPNILERGISDHYTGPELDEAIKRMEIIESHLAEQDGDRKLSQNRFGYKRSESLYCFENGNVPNNVFPIFWWRFAKHGRRLAPMFDRL